MSTRFDELNRRLAFKARSPDEWSSWRKDAIRTLRQLTGYETMKRVPLASPMTKDDRLTRIACVGNSITYGAGVEGRELNCYPAVLGRLLGSAFETRNFGVNGATYLKKGDYAYWNQKAFQEASEFSPDGVIIKLGTNDSKPQNWRFKREFTADVRAMIDHFKNFPSNPKLWICAPVPVYKSIGGITEAVVGGEVVPLVRQIARTEQISFIDTYAALSNRPELFPDGVHPNAAGASKIAKTVASFLKKHYSNNLNCPLR